MVGELVLVHLTHPRVWRNRGKLVDSPTKKIRETLRAPGSLVVTGELKETLWPVLVLGKSEVANFKARILV